MAELRPRHSICASVSLAASLLAACAAPGWQGQTLSQLHEYQAAFARDAGNRFNCTATSEELVALARRVRVLWLGDHHRNGALHRRHLALLQQLHDAGTPLCLCLEAVGTEDQPAVDAFLIGRIDIDELAAQIRQRWPGSWLDAVDVDSDHYRRLLAFARETATPVVGLEPAPRLALAHRDAKIASSVQSAAARCGDRLVVVVVGQAHLLGCGQLPQRAGLPGLMLGGDPTAALRRASPPRPLRGFVRSDGGLWFFADLLP